ncbi:hypothetical protein Bca4012_044133 [Brassica carinata]|uniref:Uncharacterized protein n=1 Tax=Brassica carinata TaxID=52824 RepID=A0A8X7QW50_BRACI|nr:hypothetical protein Bca52824_058325 [Brassica carinata]
MDTRQREKEKEKEKDLAPGEQTPKNQEQEAETSCTDERVGLNTAGGVEDVDTGPKGEVAEPSMREMLEAVKLMGAQMVTPTLAFTPLVNSFVGQVTPPVRVAAWAAGALSAKFCCVSNLPLPFCP